MSRGKKRLSRTGSQFMLAKGRGRYRVGRKKRNKKYKRRLKKNKAPAVVRWKEKKDRGCDVDSAGRAGRISRGQILIHPEVP